MRKSYTVVLLALSLCCLASCGDDDGADEKYAPTRQEQLLDSITLGNEAILKMTYDSQRRATSLLTGNGFQDYFGYDSVMFSYPDPQTILVERSQVETLLWNMRTRRTYRSVFHLSDGLITSGKMDVSGTDVLKDSMTCEYSGGRLQSQTLYECFGDRVTLVCRRTFAWDDQDLSVVTAQDNEGQPYCTIRYAYQPTVAKALLPCMSADYVEDNHKAYLTVLAAMGYFGAVSRDMVHEITIDYATPWRADYKAEYEITGHSDTGVQELYSQWWQLHDDTLVSQYSYLQGQVLHWRQKR